MKRADQIKKLLPVPHRLVTINYLRKLRDQVRQANVQFVSLDQTRDMRHGRKELMRTTHVVSSELQCSTLSRPPITIAAESKREL
jgi:hypothetical protein